MKKIVAVYLCTYSKLAIITLFLFTVPNLTIAACTVFSTDSAPYYKYQIPPPTIPTFNPNNYTVGATIYTYSFPVAAYATNSAGTYGGTYLCSELWYVYLGGVGVQTNNIYPTSIAGLGLRLSTTQQGLWPNSSLYLSANGQRVLSDIFSTLTVQFIKTGDITSINSLTGAFASIRQNTSSGQELGRISWATPVFIKPTVPTCSVATSLLNVSMGMVSSNMFSGIGSTSRGGIPFQLQLACSGGSTGTYTNAYVTLTDNYNQGNVTNALSTLSGNGTASGVGIQILKDGTILSFGPDSSSAGNTNQWFSGSIIQGRTSFSIPLMARFVQTQNTISPGSVNARATFTMSYQ
jgi:type 1 fimbria pilin